MEHLSFHKNDYLISTDPALLNQEYIHHYLSTQSYWAENIPQDVVSRSIDGSCCFGMYQNDQQIGFARVVTDYATFGYLCDVFIDEAFRGRGLSKWMMEVIHNHPQLQGFRNWTLGTRDAHGLYEQFGYTVHPEPHRMMRKNDPDVYKSHAKEN
ncbi:MAG: GNAT family N-acetyltransferase [Bacteroidota bacterium]